VLDLTQRLPASFPWRTATLVVGALALVELLALISIGAVHLATSQAKPAQAAAAVHHRNPVMRPPVVPVHRNVVRSHPLRGRRNVSVLVLNGNGVHGAAAATAARLQGLGYRLGGAENAPRHDYARSMILFVPGYVREARRLAHDTGVRLVSPIDGLPRSQLRTSKLVVLLGN
jgi:hypothetical protein